ncbi:MAG: plasmid pRiA4b ORF-3 family protein [Methanoregula sp.]|nr:plasmid pRiA4b ORF-3 family protein [Methanoregula sp.]
MKKRTAPPDEVLALLKVTQTDWYGHVRGFPYRVIAIPENASLYDLGHAILSAFRFDRDHLFGFYENLHRYYHSQEGYVLTSGVGIGNRFPGVKRAKIATVFPEPKKKMLFVYDFGDEWRFIVQAKGRALPVDGVKYPVVIESCGDNPDQYPEDELGPPAPVPVVTAGDLDRQAAVAWQKKKMQESALPERSPEPEDRSQKKIDLWLT